jgi:hypothetical protein
MTLEQACTCVNAVHAADFALNTVEQILAYDPQGEGGTVEAFELLRLALAQFLDRLSVQFERRLPASRDTILDVFRDLGANLDTQRSLGRTGEMTDPLAYPMRLGPMQ